MKNKIFLKQFKKILKEIPWYNFKYRQRIQQRIQTLETQINYE